MNQTLPELATKAAIADTDVLGTSEATGIVANVEDVTQANPAVVTSTGHGLSNGQQVYFYDVEGMTELNGNTYTVANKTNDTFELSGTNSSGFGAYTTGGSFTTNRLKKITVSSLKAFVTADVASDITDLQGNDTAQQAAILLLAGDITTLQGNATSQQSQITSLQGNATAQQDQIDTLLGNASAQQSQITTLQGNDTAQQTQINAALGNITSLQDSLGNLTLDSLGNVSTSGVADNQVLIYDAGTGNWAPGDMTGGGGGSSAGGNGTIQYSDGAGGFLGNESIIFQDTAGIASVLLPMIVISNSTGLSTNLTNQGAVVEIDGAIYSYAFGPDSSTTGSFTWQLVSSNGSINIAMLTLDSTNGVGINGEYHLALADGNPGQFVVTDGAGQYEYTDAINADPIVVTLGQETALVSSLSLHWQAMVNCGFIDSWGPDGSTPGDIAFRLLSTGAGIIKYPLNFYGNGTVHINNGDLTFVSGPLNVSDASEFAANLNVLGDLGVTGDLTIGTTKKLIETDLTPVSDGTYTVGIGGSQNGTITVQNGRIVAVVEAS